jgi:hypothetical protein
VAIRGFYPSSRSLFVPCAPSEACQGGVNSSVLLVSDSVAGCGPNYSGLRCAECRSGSYRRGGRCHPCPNTAWLLFLSFAFAIVAAVGAAVYLSRKRVNLAGLSVGVVRACCLLFLSLLQVLLLSLLWLLLPPSQSVLRNGRG